MRSLIFIIFFTVSASAFSVPYVTVTVNSYIDSPYSFNGVCYPNSKEAFYAYVNSFPVFSTRQVSAANSSVAVVPMTIKSFTLIDDSVVYVDYYDQPRDFYLVTCAGGGIVPSYSVHDILISGFVFVVFGIGLLVGLKSV